MKTNSNLNEKHWYSQDLKLQACVNETYCLPQTPKVVYGLRGSTANVYLSNAAYREFLFKQFNVSTVDEESAAVVMVYYYLDFEMSLSC